MHILVTAVLFIIIISSSAYFYKNKMHKERLVPLWQQAGVFVLAEILYLLLFYRYGYTVFYSFKMVSIWCWLVLIAGIDYEEMIIPNTCVLIGLAAVLIFGGIDIFLGGTAPLQAGKFALMGGLLGFGTFALCSALSKGGVGMGDIKLYTVLGLLLGWEGTFTVLFFCIFCTAVYAIVALFIKKKDKKTMVPIGPFTWLGMTIAILLGI